jgi:MFS family permease
MTSKSSGSQILRSLFRDGRLLFTTRILRLFAYGFLSVILALYLAQAGLSLKSIGLLLTLTLVGDMGISLWITTHADRIGRRKMLILGAMLMLFAGVVFAFTNNFFLLVVAAMIGVISPSGNEIGPFLSVEQASLTQTSPGEKKRTSSRGITCLALSPPPPERSSEGDWRIFCNVRGCPFFGVTEWM